MNATYWTVKPGQIDVDEVVCAGGATARAAWVELGKAGTGRVVCLQTIESERPIENIAYQPFESTRYCVVVLRED